MRVADCDFFFKFNSYSFYLFLAVLGLRFVRGLSLVVASGGHSSSRCADLSLTRPLPFRGTGSRRAGSAVVAHRPSCSAACGIFPDQGSNPCPLHYQADSQPLHHQGSPLGRLFKNSSENAVPEPRRGTCCVFQNYIRRQSGNPRRLT